MLPSVSIDTATRHKLQQSTLMLVVKYFNEDSGDFQRLENMSMNPNFETRKARRPMKL